MRSSISFSLIPIVFFLLGLISVNLYGQEVVEWEAVDGASYYRIQIRQNGIIIMDTTTMTNSSNLFLPPGDYEFQVFVMNVFDREVSSTELTPLKILPKIVPFITDYTPKNVVAGGKIKFTIHVIGFRNNKNDQSVFHLANSEGKKIQLQIVEVKQEKTDMSESIVVLDIQERLPRGTWNLIMTNPDGRVSMIENAIVAKNNQRLRIRSIKPTVLTVGGEYNHVVMDVVGIEEDADIIFSGPSDIKATLIQKSEDGLLDFNLDLGNVKTGWYSIEIRNPSGNHYLKNRAFRTEEPLEILQYLKKADSVSVLNRSHFFAVGYSINLPIAESAEIMEAKYFGFSFGYGHDIMNDFFKRNSILRNIDFDFYVKVSTLNNTQFGTDDISMWQFMLFPGLCYNTSFKFPINGIMKLGVGLAYSFYTLGKNDSDISIEHSQLSSRNSLDIALRLGAGAQVKFSNRLFLNLSVDFINIFYYDSSSQFLYPNIEVGLQW